MNENKASNTDHAISLNLHGTIRPDNYNEALEATKLYGPHRLTVSLYLKGILTDLGLTWCLDGGTLLGAWRDGFMLPHDDDLDMVVYHPWLLPTKAGLEWGSDQAFEDRALKVLEQLRDMVQARLPAPYEARVITTYAKKVEVYDPTWGKYPFRKGDYHNVTCDLTLLLQSQVSPDILLFQHKDLPYQQIRRGRFFPLSEIMYEGSMYPAPGSPEAYLRDSYGYIGTGAVFNKGSGYYEKRVQPTEDELGPKNNWEQWVWSPLCMSDCQGKCQCECNTCRNVYDTRTCECRRKLNARDKPQVSEPYYPTPWALTSLCIPCGEEGANHTEPGGKAQSQCQCVTCSSEADDRECECRRKRKALGLIKRLQEEKCHCEWGRLGHVSGLSGCGAQSPYQKRLEEWGQNWTILTDWLDRQSQ